MEKSKEAPDSSSIDPPLVQPDTCNRPPPFSIRGYVYSKRRSTDHERLPPMEIPKWRHYELPTVEISKMPGAVLYKGSDHEGTKIHVDKVTKKNIEVESTNVATHDSLEAHYNEVEKITASLNNIDIKETPSVEATRNITDTEDIENALEALDLSGNEGGEYNSRVR